MKAAIERLTNQCIYYPNTGSYGMGAVHHPQWNDKEAWGTIGRGRTVIGRNIELDEDGLLVSADWEAVEKRRGG